MVERDVFFVEVEFVEHPRFMPFALLKAMPIPKLHVVVLPYSAL